MTPEENRRRLTAMRARPSTPEADRLRENAQVTFLEHKRLEALRRGGRATRRKPGVRRVDRSERIA